MIYSYPGETDILSLMNPSDSEVTYNRKIKKDKNDPSKEGYYPIAISWRSKGEIFLSRQVTWFTDTALANNVLFTW